MDSKKDFKEAFERASFIFSQAKAYVDGGIKTSNTLDDKAFKIFGYTFLILNAVLGYIFANYHTLNSSVLFGFILYGICLGIVNFLLIQAVDLADFHITGNLAENLTDIHLQELSCDELILAEAKGYTLRATDNKSVNHRKAKKIKQSLNILIYSIPVVLLISFISWIIY